MKAKFLFPSVILCLLFVTSCTNKYEKAIEDYNQNVIYQTGQDIGFKAKEIKEIKNITVADSLAIYQKQESDIFANMAQLLKVLRQVRVEHAKMVEERVAQNPALKESGDQLLLATENEFNKVMKDSTDYATFFNNVTKRLQGLDPNEVISVVVECKYSLKNPLQNNELVEGTTSYTMSPDGKVCHGLYVPTE